MNNIAVFTIGHSSRELDSFRQLLKQNGVNAIIDVRTSPFSAHVPQFNKESLKRYLASNDIFYLHLPEAFGARREDPELLDDIGRVDFEKVRQTAAFASGIDRIRDWTLNGKSPCLMCSEANPLDCHRFSMISYQLVREGFLVRHILKEAELLMNEDLEQLLLQKYKHRIEERSFFDNSSSLEVAYRLANDEIGYRANGRRNFDQRMR